jgi:hypothetical protein
MGFETPNYIWFRLPDGKGVVGRAIVNSDGEHLSQFPVQIIDTNGDQITGLQVFDRNLAGMDDNLVKALNVISYEHHEIHAESHYFIEDVADLALNNVFDVQWTTPNTTKWEHFTFELNCESETMWYIYEGAVVNVAGTALTAINNNRNSSNTSDATIKSIQNTSLALANADTDVSGALELAHGIIGAGRSGGITIRDREIILKQNTIYCMRAIASAAGYTNFLMEWYEHTNK